MKGLSYNKNKPTWKREEFSLPLATFFLLLHDKLPYRKKAKGKSTKHFSPSLEANI